MSGRALVAALGFSSPPPCACGCGTPAAPHKRWPGNFARYATGHSFKSRHRAEVAPLCKCGCGKPAGRNPKKRGGFSKYAPGHWTTTPEASRRVPKLCVCGCGKTTLTKWVRGHAGRKHGHDPKQAGVNERLWRVYKLTRRDYDAMLVAQEGRCAICGTDQPGLDRYGAPSMFSVDHDHATGKVRDLLCRQCNAGLGSFEDDPTLVAKAAAYLRRHK